MRCLHAGVHHSVRCLFLIQRIFGSEQHCLGLFEHWPEIVDGFAHALDVFSPGTAQPVEINLLGQFLILQLVGDVADADSPIVEASARAPLRFRV